MPKHMPKPKRMPTYTKDFIGAGLTGLASLVLYAFENPAAAYAFLGIAGIATAAGFYDLHQEGHLHKIFKPLKKIPQQWETLSNNFRNLLIPTEVIRQNIP